MATYDYLGDQCSDGVIVCKNTSNKLAFYGGTPMAKSTLTATAVVTTVAVSTTSNIWGFSTSTQANAIVSLVNELRALIVALGLSA